MKPQAQSQPSRAFPTREPVDFVVIGSGAAGGIIARELSRGGFDVVVLEQGPTGARRRRATTSSPPTSTSR